jgi:catechol 2,3-dioxygenase-like lactoylglutathione lyase family enzyme
MFVGKATLCLRVKDLERSIRFYEALGMQALRVGQRGDGSWAAAGVRRCGLPAPLGDVAVSPYFDAGALDIYLMCGFGGDSITFRGADVHEVREHLRREGWKLEGEPKPSWGWSTWDPDGHGLFFNTHVEDTTPEYREAKVSELLRSTEWNLLDLGASEECLRVFREHVLPRSAVVPPAAGPGLFAGGPELCFRVKNLDESIRFYESLGLERVDGVGGPGVSALVRRGGFRISLMTFGQDSRARATSGGPSEGYDPHLQLYFGSADAFEVQEHLRRQGLEPDGKPERGTRGGSVWMTSDPDGHAIFFDCHPSTVTSASRQARIGGVLRNTEQDLVDLGASAECLQAFREHVLARFGS